MLGRSAAEQQPRKLRKLMPSAHCSRLRGHSTVRDKNMGRRPTELSRLRVATMDRQEAAAGVMSSGQVQPRQIMATRLPIAARTLLLAAHMHCPAAGRGCLLLGNTAEALGAERGRHCVSLPEMLPLEFSRWC